MELNNFRTNRDQTQEVLSGTPLRDRAFLMRHHIDPALGESVGLALTGSKGVDSVAVSVVAEAILAAREGRATSYSRNERSYRGLVQYGGPAFTYTNVTRAVDHVASLGLIDLTAGFWRSDGSGRRSTFTAAAALVELGNAAPRILLNQRTNLILKDKDKAVVPFGMTRETRSLSRDLSAWTEAVRGANIRLDAEDVSWLDDSTVAVPHTDRNGQPGSLTISTGEFAFYRVYNNRRFSQGGRAYGHWSQTIPAWRRAQIRINGQPVALLDFSASHPRMLYAKAGIPLCGDPYDVPGIDRETAKLALLVVLNATSRRQGVEAMAHKMMTDRAITDEDRKAARDLLEALETRHAPIASQFYQGSGLACQRIEAEILADVARLARKDGIVTLPVHDEVICADRHGERVREMMAACWCARVGGCPVIK